MKLLGFPDNNWELWGIDKLHNAVVHIRKQFSLDMTRDEAQSNLDARVIMWRLESKLLDEAEARSARFYNETCP